MNFIRAIPLKTNKNPFFPTPITSRDLLTCQVPVAAKLTMHVEGDADLLNVQTAVEAASHRPSGSAVFSC